ncbi:plant invertase/pectin methylesterase inhibitor [Striga asiatica]|uniref:Plant invertase/pectin methylesterase inhibitor n=1 Tax=Striga asiatica TaxID=4170 RepID=A0A5A7RB55_STRAF|nr:plant invertase/pectin methylesterase inhibitor [Striga asiatica]
MKSYSFFMILLFLLLLMTTKSQNLIDSTCRASSRNDPNINYDFCKTVLQSSPATRSSSTLNGIGKILITLVLNNLTDTHSYIERLTKDAAKWWEPYVRQCLDDCLELYSDGIDYADQAMSYYDATKFEDANVAISSVIDDVTTCEDGFEERKGSVLPLSERNNGAFRLSALALSVMRMVRIGY